MLSNKNPERARKDEPQKSDQERIKEIRNQCEKGRIGGNLE